MKRNKDIIVRGKKNKKRINYDACKKQKQNVEVINSDRIEGELKLKEHANKISHYKQNAVSEASTSSLSTEECLKKKLKN